MRFDSIVGYDRYKQQWRGMVASKRIPHAQLIIGSEGGPGMALALAFITYLHCLQPLEKEACGVCVSCHKMEKLIHPDCAFIFPTGASTRSKGKLITPAHHLSTWRAFLLDHPYGGLHDWAERLDHHKGQLQIGRAQVEEMHKLLLTAPFESTYRVILLWKPELLHLSAANALLKKLEEPAPHTLFLLVTTQVTQVLPTIYSRAWPIRLPFFSEQELKQMLSKRYPHQESQVHEQIIKGVSGNLGKAYKLSSEKGQGRNFAMLAEAIRAAYTQDWKRLVAQVDRFGEKKHPAQRHFLSYARQLLRQALLAQVAPSMPMPLSAQEKVFCQRLGGFLALDQLEEVLAICEEMEKKSVRKAAPKLLFLHGLLRIASLFKPIP